MRIPGALLVSVASLGLIVACAADDDEAGRPRTTNVDPAPAAAESSPTVDSDQTSSTTSVDPSVGTTVISTTTVSPTTVSPTTVISTTTSGPATTISTTTASTTTASPATIAGSTDVKWGPLVLDQSTTVASIGIFGDSLVADLTAIGGRDNQVVPRLSALLVGNGELDVERVENLAVPGQSVVSDLGLLTAEDATIRPYVERTLLERAGPVDLAIVAISSSDINLNASLPEPISTEALAQQMLDELSVVADTFRTAGVDVVFLPIFGINDTVFSNLRCALAATCPTGPDAQIDTINAIFWDSELPMLFERFDRLDTDGDGRTDRAWFDDVDPRYPDDGIHPNAEGQAIYSTTVAQALAALLS